MGPRIPPNLLQVHRRYNRNSAERWEGFANHRAQVTALLREGPGPRLAVLGAGNLNDLDLEALAGAFSEIHLVDLDQEAVARAVARQPAPVRVLLRVHAPVDLSGVLPRLVTMKDRSSSPAQIANLGQTSQETVIAALPGPFDTVLSAGLLSQLMHGCRVALGVEHRDLQAVADSLMLAHLRTLVRLVRPGGTGILVTDTVSSESYPLEELWDERSPLDLLHHLEATDNLFYGTSATRVREAVARDPEIAPLLQQHRLVEPWLWRLGPDVTLLAYALVFQRCPAAP